MSSARNTLPANSTYDPDLERRLASEAVRVHSEQRKNPDHRPQIKLNTPRDARREDAANATTATPDGSAFPGYDGYPLVTPTATPGDAATPLTFSSPYDLQSLSKLKELEDGDPAFAERNAEETKRLLFDLSRDCANLGGGLGDWTRALRAWEMQRDARNGDLKCPETNADALIKVRRVGSTHAVALMRCVYCGREEETWQVGTKAAVANIKQKAFLHAIKRDMNGGACPETADPASLSGVFPEDQHMTMRLPDMTLIESELTKTKAIMGQEWLKTAAMLAVNEALVGATGCPVEETPFVPNLGDKIRDAFYDITDAPVLASWIQKQGSPLEGDKDGICMQPDITTLYCDVHDMAVGCGYNVKDLVRMIRSTWANALRVPDMGVAQLRQQVATALREEHGAGGAPPRVHPHTQSFRDKALRASNADPTAAAEGEEV